MNLSHALSKIVGEEGIIADAATLSAYSEDSSFVPYRSPDAVVKPRTSEEVIDIVKWANQEKIPLIPVSSQCPGLRGATIPRLGGVIIDLSRMSSVIRLDRKNRVVLIEPGVTFEALIPELQEAGLKLSMPLLPPAKKSVLASALEREPTIMPRYHWDIADPLLCLEVIFGSGEQFRTGEAAGPGSLETQWERGGAQKFPLGPHQVDYHRLIQGSQGTTGIVTWASIKCEINPKIQKCFFLCSDRLEHLYDFTCLLIRLDLADELFIVNPLTLASITAKEPEEIEKGHQKWPSWILVFTLSGLDYFPEERLAYRQADMLEKAQALELTPLESIEGLNGETLISLINHPSEETYWKNRYRGGCQEIFFTTTLDQSAGFIQTMNSLAKQYDFPVNDVGIYIQPIVQGTSCQVAFDLSYDPHEKTKREIVQALYPAAVEALMDQGGFFNRPCPITAEQVFSRFAEYTAAVRKVKTIFDPNGIMNPGKLCF